MKALISFFRLQTTSEEEFGLIIRSLRAIFQNIHPTEQQIVSDEDDLSDDGQRSSNTPRQVADLLVTYNQK